MVTIIEISKDSFNWDGKTVNWDGFREIFRKLIKLVKNKMVVKFKNVI